MRHFNSRYFEDIDCISHLDMCHHSQNFWGQDFCLQIPIDMKRGLATKEPVAKRQVLTDFVNAAGPSCSQTALARGLLSLHKNGVLDEKLFAKATPSHYDNGENEHQEERTVRGSLHDAIAEDAGTETPYGTVCQKMSLPQQDARDFEWTFIHPFALLHYLTLVSNTFGSIVATHLQNRENNFILYHDSARPGNVLRPDKGRSYVAVYWTILELPEFLRHRDIGWFPFGFVRATILSKMPTAAPMSNLAARILKVFFHPTEFNFAVGCRCKFEGRDVFIRGKFTGFLGDELALKETLNVRGASGSKPCFCCKNIVGKRTDITGQNYLVGLETSKCAQLDKHTDQSFYEMIDLLQRTRPHCPQKQFDKLCQALGLNYCTEGLLFDDYCRGLVRPISGCFWDWMHVLVNSGLADTELGLFAQAMTSEGIKMENLEDFFLGFQGLKGLQGNCSKGFLTKRLRGDGSPFKGFASELLSVMPIVRLFSDMVLKPAHKLVDHATCWDRLCTMVDILMLGDKAVQYAEPLRRITEEHHGLYITIYGQECAFPKFHYAMHLADVLLASQCNLSCFTTERKHRMSKTIGARVFQGIERTLAENVLADTVSQFKAGDKLHLERLHKNNLIRDAEILQILKEEFPTALQMYVCTSATVEAGEIRKGNICLMEISGDNFEMVEILSFLKVVDENGAVFLVHVAAVPKVGTNRWRRNVEDTKIYPASKIKRTLIYAPLTGDDVRIAETIHTRSVSN